MPISLRNSVFYLSPVDLLNMPAHVLPILPMLFDRKSFLAVMSSNYVIISSAFVEITVPLQIKKSTSRCTFSGFSLMSISRHFLKALSNKSSMTMIRSITANSLSNSSITKQK